jgi:hypothetical protein
MVACWLNTQSITQTAGIVKARGLYNKTGWPKRSRQIGLLKANLRDKSNPRRGVL